MACITKVLCAGSSEWEFPRDEGRAPGARGVLCVTVADGGEGWDTLVFLVDPARSSFAVRPAAATDGQSLAGGTAILEIRAILPCYFSSAEVALAIDLDCADARITRLDVGEVTLLGSDLSGSKIGRLLFTVVHRHEPHQSRLFRQLGRRTLLFWAPRPETVAAVVSVDADCPTPGSGAIGAFSPPLSRGAAVACATGALSERAKETAERCGLAAPPPELPPAPQAAVWERPALAMRFARVATRDVTAETSWTPVFETAARVRGELSAYGYGAALPSDSHCIRLVQAPAEVAALPRGPAGARTWYIAVRDLSFEWGRTIWNDALGELTRPGELDPQHATLFAPTLDGRIEPLAGGGPRWDLVLSQPQPLAPAAPASGREPAAWPTPADARCHSLRLAAAEPSCVSAVFPLLRDTTGRRIATVLPLSQPASEHCWPRPGEPGILQSGMAIALRSVVATAIERQALRIGALEIQLATGELSEDQDLADELLFDLSPEATGGRYRWERADVTLSFAVSAASPGGQDPLPGESLAVCSDAGAADGDQRSGALADPDEETCRYEREPALVIPWRRPFSGPAGGGEARMRLQVKERASRLDQQRIDLRLTTMAVAAADTTAPLPAATADPLQAACAENADYLDGAVVLDREPFLVAKVSFPRLGLLDDPEEGNEVARWQSYGQAAGIWNIRFPATVQDFCLTLPPQAVGEEMEKYQRLESPDDPLAERRFDFRLSPPASLAMRQSYYQQSFAEAPWNLRELLANPSRELPGAQLDHLQYELLYGLSCRLDYSAMRLAEMAALVGEVQGGLPDAPAWAPAGAKLRDGARKAYRQARQRWQQARWRTRQRLGIFELWDIARLDTLELSTGVTCWIRHSPLVPPTAAGISSEATLKGAPADSLQQPEADLADPFQPAQRIGEAASPLAARHEPPLAGGATWGFESRNIYQAVMRPGADGSWPRSNTASTNDLRLTALGAYGHQMAAFDNFRTKVLADATMGRTWSYTLERIGRIAVWWNRAKHVIVYERTVLPSAQFAGDQPPLAGRAVVRKVEEFVELLENNRVYPDRGNGQSRDGGFVAACTFAADPNKVVRYHVRSDWGCDVGRIGWKVPLWMPGADPAVYPKPRVDLTLHTVADGQSSPGLLTIDDPQNLFFYTDTQPPPPGQENADLSNTDLWLPVEGIDFCDEAQPASAGAQAFAASTLRPASAADVTIPGGLRPCTFLLAPGEHAVNLVANRSGDPMGAVLQSVTLCRARLRPATDLTRAASTLASNVAAEVDNLLAAVPVQPIRLPDVKKLLNGAVDGLCQKLQGAVTAAAQGLQQGIATAHQKLSAIGDGVDAQIEKLDIQAVRAMTAGVAQLAAFPDQLLASMPATITKDEMKEELSAELDYVAAQAALLPASAAYLGSVQAALQQTVQQLGAVTAALGALPDKPLAAPVLPELSQRLQAIVAALGAVSERIRTLADSGPALPITSSNGPVPIPLGIAVRWVLARIRPDAIAGAFDLAQATAGNVEDLRRQLSADLEALAASRLADLRAAGEVLQDHAAALSALLTQVEGRLREVAGEQERAVRQFRDAVAARLAAVIDRAPGLPQTDELRAAWAAAVEAERTEIERRMQDALRNRSQGFFQAADRLLPDPDPAKLQQQLGQAVQEGCGALRTQLDRLLDELTDGAGKDLDLDSKVAEVKAFLGRQRDAVVAQLDGTLGQQVRTARKLIGAVEHDTSSALGLVRAFGKPPTVSGLDFDRSAIAFFYDPASDLVDVTPVVGRAAQASAAIAQLKPFGVALPVLRLGTQLIPASLETFDLASILPNIAGISLQSLFANVKMPRLGLPGQLDDRIQVKHGVDPQTRQAWVSVTADFDIAGAQQMFSIGPLAVEVDTPHFHAETRIDGGAAAGAASGGGPVTRRVSGSLKGDWKLRIGGFELITFKATELDFDASGNLHYHIEPRNVQLSPALDFINGLLTTLSPGGVTTRFDGDGVVSTLDLPIPDTQLGAFGYSGLRLGASLALRFGSADGFNIGVSASLARRDAPFTLTIFVLGGAGYLEVGARYFPSSQRVTATLDLAIEASASLAIALGPIQGGVAVYVGVTASYDGAAGGGLAVGLLFMVRGSVSVLAIATASIVLSLAGQYQSGVLTGTGSLDISIKICWCYTLEVHQSVSYSLATGGSSPRHAALQGPRAVARIASLEGFVPPEDTPLQPCSEMGLDPALVIQGVDEYFRLLAPAPARGALS